MSRVKPARITWRTNAHQTFGKHRLSWQFQASCPRFINKHFVSHLQAADALMARTSFTSPLYHGDIVLTSESLRLQ